MIPNYELLHIEAECIQKVLLPMMMMMIMMMMMVMMMMMMIMVMICRISPSSSTTGEESIISRSITR